MVKSIDEITLQTYFRIICSDPFSLSPLGKGTEKELIKCWDMIVRQDAKSNLSGTYNRAIELQEDRRRLSYKILRITACLIGHNYEHKESIDILESLGIKANDNQNILAIAEDRLNGLKIKLDEIDKELDTKSYRPNMSECMKQLVIVQTYIPSINLQSSLAEYRAAQSLIREMNQKKENGKSYN